MAGDKIEHGNLSSEENKSDIDSEDRVPSISISDRRDSGSSLGEECINLTEILREKIIAQAEFYFSDENLTKDKFLLKHVKRNKEGYVNIKLIASFKQMRLLTRDYKMIAEALKSSSKLVVDKNGLKLRRVEPLPRELLDQAQVQHLVLTDIPHENPSIDFIKNAFNFMVDDILSVQIIKSNQKFPNVLQSHYSRHPELKEKVVAVVEFKNVDSAKEALKAQFSDIYKDLKVSLLEVGPKQLRKIAGSETPSDADSDVNNGKKKKKKKNTIVHYLSPRDDSYSSCASSSDSEFSSFLNCGKRYTRSQKNVPDNTSQHFYRNEAHNSSQNFSPLSSPTVSPVYHRKKKSAHHSSAHKEYKLSPLISNLSPGSSPDVNRKEIAKSKESYESCHSAWMLKRLELNKSSNIEPLSTIINGTCKQLEIIRQPKGPDGSNGFKSQPLIKYVLTHSD